MPPPSASRAVVRPAKAEMLRNSTLSASESRSWLQSRVALRVRWRAAAVRLAPLSTSSLWATCSTARAPILAVAISMARGIPSSFRHTLATAPAFFSVISKSGSLRRARSTNSLSAS
jgi:hypothetical protein